VVCFETDVCQVNADWLKKEIKWWEPVIPAEADGEFAYPQVWICKFMIASTCYAMKQIGPEPGAAVEREDLEDLIDAYVTFAPF
jgi:hypothetical protein